MTMTDTKRPQHYQLLGNPVVPVPIVGNLRYDQELGAEAVARLNEEFKGVEGIGDRTKYSQGDLVTQSNTPRNLFYHYFFRNSQQDLRVQSPIDMVRYWKVLLERGTTYADSNAVSVFPKPGPNEDLRMAVLKAFGKTATTVPLLVMGLRPVRSDKCQGFALERTDHTELREAPYLAQNGRVKYDPAADDLVAATADEEGVQIFVPRSQSGLRGAFRNRGYYLSCGVGRLLDSYAGGRVPMIQVPKGRAENLDALVTSLNAERERQVTEANVRFERARKYMQTGQF